jgi:hypothetical protein
MASVLILFLDGVGLGDANPEVNPFMRAEMPFMRSLLGVPYLVRSAAGTRRGQAILLGLDASLGVNGLPQSATGQTAILTGTNAPALLGEHFGPYPTSRLRRLLGEESIFQVLTGEGQPVAYANAYPHRFLDRLARGKGRLSANTTAARLAGLKLRERSDLIAGRAINALLTNEFWPEPGITLPVLSAYEAGQNLAALTAEHTLTFFEFWYSDYLGHKMDREGALSLLVRLDEFFAGIVETLDFRRSLLLVVSDHGNFEDWTTKKHTHNPAFSLLMGDKAVMLAGYLRSLIDVKPLVLNYLNNSTM